MKPVSAIQSLMRTLLTALLALIVAVPTFAQANDRDEHHHRKIVGGYFEEWSIYYAGYNIANLQQNGVADKLTHLTYAFGGVTATGCTIADSWADYQYSLPAECQRCPLRRSAVWQLRRSAATQTASSQLKGLDFSRRRQCVGHFRFRYRGGNGSRTESFRSLLYRSLYQRQCRAGHLSRGDLRRHRSRLGISQRLPTNKTPLLSSASFEVS